jgi:hypothetical protein
MGTNVDLDTPLRLSEALKLAFPHGGMTVSGLRRERDRNRLVVETIAGKEFTTLAAIARMRQLCRSEAKGRDCGSIPGDPTKTAAPPGLSETAQSSAALASARDSISKLKERSPNTSSPENPPRVLATVTRLKSGSPT